MTEQNQLFRLSVDGKVLETNVPVTELADRLSKYGVNRRGTLDRLLNGEKQRVLGQNLRVLRMPAEATDPMQVQTTIGSSKSAESEAEVHRDASAQPKPAVATPFDPALQELSTRAKSLRKGTLIYGGIALALAVIGGLFYAFGVAAEPTTSISRILVPDVIAVAFNSADTFSGPGGMPGVDSTLDSILGSTLFQVFCVVAMIVGLAFTIVSGRFFNIIPSLMVGFIPHFIAMFLGIGGPNSTIKPNEFDSAVESKNLSTLESLLSSRVDLDEMAKAYVLAQASVADGKSTKWVVLSAKSLREGGSIGNLAVPANVAYAIEAADLGPKAAFSERAEQYRQSALSKAEDLKRNGFWIAFLAGMLGMVATVHESIAQVIFRRVRRITKLLDPVVSSFIHPRS